MPFSRTSLPSIRSKLYTLVLACSLPILIGYIALARDAAVRERIHVSQDAQTVAEVLAAALDRDLDSGETAARVLANSSMLARGDLAAFHAAARQLLRPEFPAQGFVLSGPDAMPILHTRYPYGVPLPRSSNPDDIKHVFATGDAIASGLHRLDPEQPSALTVDVPVWKEGKVAYVLSVQLRPRRLAELLDSQHLPPGWVAEIYDKRRLMVARSSDPSAHLGSAMEPALAQAVQKGVTGTVPLGPNEGAAGFAAYSRSPKHGWVVAIRYPADAARALLGHSVASTVMAIAVLLAISLGLAWSLGGAIARAVQGLAGPAESLGRGEPLALPRPEIKEVDTVAHALRRVDGELQAYRTRLESLVAARTAELERSKAQLEIVYASAPVGLCFMDTDMRVVMINDYLAKLNARPVREHIGKTLSELLGKVGEDFEVGYRRVLANGRPLVELEDSGEVPATPGELRHWISSYYPVYGPDRKLVGVNAVVLDITERKRQEQRNRDNEEMFRALFEASGDAHVLLAYGAGFVSANQAAAELFGYPDVASLLSQSPASTSPPTQLDGRPSEEAALDHMRRTMEEGRHQFEWLHKRVDGSVFHADVLLNRVDIGGQGMMQGTIRDISARVAAEAALRATQSQLVEALHQAEAGSRAKGEFLANMSHELRTPMNAIVGLARLLEEGQLGRRERGYVARMKTAARSLLGMLSDLLDFSRIEAGHLTLERIRFRIDDVLTSIAVLTAPNAWAKGVEPVFEVDASVPYALLGDPTRLEQVLLNLVGNAVKFTASGEIVLSIRVLERDGQRVLLGFAVRDTGIGIAPEQQAHMFEAFSQGDSSTSRKYGGAGLGLAISRRLVELAGGSLSVASRLGAGAEFQFAIPFQVLDEERPAAPAAGQALRVLVADDNDSARAALLAACAACGWEAAGAHTGSAALERLRAGRYDLAFLDTTMPDLDGVAVLSAARAAQLPALPRCCLLAAEPDAERLAELADELGVDAVLAKPFTFSTLHAAAARLLGDTIPAPAVSAPLAGRLQGLRVLLVEDNPINQEVASFILNHAGAAVDIAANGRVAVSMLAERADYDVVLMDLQMPVMNGYEAAAAIRAAGLTLPIVAMTANAMDEDRRRTLEAGMQAHLAKPIDVDELLATLARITGAELAPPLPADGADPAPAELAGIDLQATLPRFGGSFERFAAVFARFADSQRESMDELRALVEADERGKAQQLAHRLRGVAANLGATAAAHAAHELELALRSADQAAVDLRLDALAQALAIVADAARGLGQPAPVEAADGLAGAGLHDALARLLNLLQNNNMKAIDEFQSLHPALAASAGPGPAAELREAIATLRFEQAARQVEELMMRRTEA